MYRPKSTHTKHFQSLLTWLNIWGLQSHSNFTDSLLFSPYPDFLFSYSFLLKSKQIALSVSYLVVSCSSLNPWPQVTLLPWLTHLPQKGLLKHFPNKGNSNSLRGILIATVKRIKCSSSNPTNNKVTKVEGDLFSFKNKLEQTQGYLSNNSSLSLPCIPICCLEWEERHDATACSKGIEPVRVLSVYCTEQKSFCTLCDSWRVI